MFGDLQQLLNLLNGQQFFCICGVGDLPLCIAKCHLVLIYYRV
jgi:hypothetical protein